MDFHACGRRNVAPLGPRRGCLVEPGPFPDGIVSDEGSGVTLECLEVMSKLKHVEELVRKVVLERCRVSSAPAVEENVAARHPAPAAIQHARGVGNRPGYG